MITVATPLSRTVTPLTEALSVASFAARSAANFSFCAATSSEARTETSPLSPGARRRFAAFAVSAKSAKRMTVVLAFDDIVQENEGDPTSRARPIPFGTGFQ